jgi:hypothetical protein
MYRMYESRSKPLSSNYPVNPVHPVQTALSPLGHREEILDGINRMYRMPESRSRPSLAPTILSILFILSKLLHGKKNLGKAQPSGEMCAKHG